MAPRLPRGRHSPALFHRIGDVVLASKKEKRSSMKTVYLNEHEGKDTNSGLSFNESVLTWERARRVVGMENAQVSITGSRGYREKIMRDEKRAEQPELSPKEYMARSEERARRKAEDAAKTKEAAKKLRAGFLAEQ